MTPPPLLLAGHGSADPAGAAAFSALRERVATLLTPASVDVAGGFIELSPPPLSDAVTELVSLGHNRVVAIPVVLAAAGHSKGDIPAALAAQRRRHPGLSFSYGRPLGPHPALLNLLAARINEVLDAGSAGAAFPLTESADTSRATPPSAAPPAAVLVVGRGSTDPDANAELAKSARLLWETQPGNRQRFAFAETAFVSLASPRVADGLERCRRLGARRVVVARYFLFPGVLPDRVAAQARAYAAARPELDIRCTGVLGDCAELAQLTVQRYREALTGDIRMNCDMCVYRAALPGFEHRVGAPQRPHYHPGEPSGTHPPGDAYRDHAH
jgi:sirohydrochlorin cobaltochelatase